VQQHSACASQFARTTAIKQAALEEFVNDRRHPVRMVHVHVVVALHRDRAEVRVAAVQLDKQRVSVAVVRVAGRRLDPQRRATDVLHYVPMLRGRVQSVVRHPEPRTVGRDVLAPGLRPIVPGHQRPAGRVCERLPGLDQRLVNAALDARQSRCLVVAQQHCAGRAILQLQQLVQSPPHDRHYVFRVHVQRTDRVEQH